MYTKRELESLENKTMDSMGFSYMTDIKEVKIDENLPYSKRLKQYFSYSNNPYFFRCGRIKVQTIFENNEETLEDIVMRLLVNSKGR